MIDVRLAATNPEDSTLVPVSCNSRGELNTVAPKIEEISNDLKVDGDLTVTGLINGSNGVGEQGPPGKDGEPGGEGPPGPQGDPGVGVPLPYGPEATVLTIYQGVPTWRDPDASPWSATLVNGMEAGEVGTIDETQVPSEDPVEYCKESGNWCAYGSCAYTGYWQVGNFSGNAPFPPMVWGFEQMFGKVLTFYYTVRGYSSNNSNNASLMTINSTWSDNNITTVTTNTVQDVTVPQRFTYACGQIKQSYIFNREVVQASVTVVPNWGEWGERNILIWTGYQIEDPGAFALNRQIEMEKRFRALRGITTDIDLSRPTWE